MRDRKKLIIIGSVLLIAIIIAVIRIITSGQDRVKEVDIGKAEIKNLTQVIPVTGNIEAGNKEEIMLPTQQKVIEIYAKKGQKVNSGDPILKIDTTDYEYQLKKYELALSLAASNLNRLQDGSRNSDKKVLENAVKQAELSVKSSEANYNEAKRKYEQIKVLYENGAASGNEYEIALKAMNDAKNQHELSVIQLSDALNSLNDFDINRNDQITDQRNQVESSKADIENIKDKIEKSTIKSSINGTIVQLDAKPDQYPTAENNTIVIYDLSKYKVTIPVSQYDAVSISLGQKSTIRVKGIDTEYKGTVSAVGDAAVITMDGANKEPKVEIEVTLDNPDDRIKVGYEADIDITLKESNDSMAVNFEAVREDEDGKKYVFTVNGNKAVKTFVETGIETDFEIEILKGLKAGDSYVKNPPATLKDGDPVKQSGGKNSDNKS
ncbi:MAG TPA: HlyD family efflux transporter periplasmic adaptor subunit [Bacillota bacterium]|nr:HlyD family efflux transporter periplasmic adaptor subunit [Bacillota bacterium]HQL36553.1 HlyD family efflux transporter periplasmic adaptor subunit [Bacillota bacterium]HRS20331.1 HlyD family efflux transporter periplasmic adaptor subunit [Clostridia bacterium]HRU42227.1 HlyD family efflux transporter periplasmic adaptor subunit [Candidatus Diapherotrites archaeon]